MKDLNKKCFICGIYESDGIMLNEKYICERCERDIASSNVNKELYNYYVKMIKKILFC